MSRHLILSVCLLTTLNTLSPNPATNDSSQQLQSLFDRGGAIVLAPGTHRITETLVIDLDRAGYTSISGNGVARLIMSGPGPAIRLIGSHDGTADPGTVKNNVWANQRMPLIDGIEIVGDHERAIGIEATGTMQLTITRVNIRNAFHGIHLVDRNRNIIISECHIYDNRGIAIYLDDVNLHQINVSNCHLSYNRGGGIVSRKGNVRNLQVGTCDIEGNMGPPGSEPTANILLDSRQGSHGIGEVAITGSTIQHTHRGPNSANIRILGDSAGPESREGHIVIANNVLSDVQVNVDIHQARGVVVTGNTFWKGYSANLVITESRDLVVSSNVFDRNPRYGEGPEVKNGLVFRRCRDGTVSSLHIANTTGEAGLLIEDCTRMNVNQCTILDCDNIGLLARNLTSSRIANCLIRDDRPDAASEVMRIIGGENNQISNNHIKD